jgi:hypothetical protein
MVSRRRAETNYGRGTKAADVFIAWPRRQAGLNAASVVNSVENRTDKKYHGCRLGHIMQTNLRNNIIIIIDRIDQYDKVTPSLPK